jgi:hypothetical protein
MTKKEKKKEKKKELKRVKKEYKEKLKLARKESDLYVSPFWKFWE